MNSFQAAAAVGIQMKCLGRVTGTVLVIAGPRRKELPENVSKINIGLQFKFPKQVCARVDGRKISEVSNCVLLLFFFFLARRTRWLLSSHTKSMVLFNQSDCAYTSILCTISNGI